MLNSQSKIKQYIEFYLMEILNNVDRATGDIKIHINPFYKAKDQGLDYPRQSFIYFTLSRLMSFLKDNNFTDIKEDNSSNLIEKYKLDEILRKIAINTKSNYTKEIDGVGRKFIELYSLRACLFNNDNDYTFWVDNFKKENINLIYTHPILLNLYLNTLKDTATKAAKNRVENIIEIDLALYHLPSAVEAYYNSIKVRKDKHKEAYNYTDMYYFNGIKYFNNNYYKAADEFIETQLLEDDKNMDMLNTSTIAKLFEGFANKSYSNYTNNTYHNNDTQIKISDEINKYFDIVVARKIKLDTRLIKDFKYTEHSISEIKNTSCVCLDTYAHLLLGLMSLFKIKETMIIQKIQ